MPGSPDGTFTRRDDGRLVLRFERSLPHPVEQVWAALTEPARLEQWLAAADLELVEGGSVELRWLNTDDEGNTAVARGTVARLEPPRLVEYDTDIHGVIRFELREHGPGCVLVFTNETPAPAEYEAMVAAGWHIHLDHLAGALGGDPVDWPRWDEEHRPAWSRLRERYEAAIEEASARSGAGSATPTGQGPGNGVAGAG